MLFPLIESLRIYEIIPITAVVIELNRIIRTGVVAAKFRGMKLRSIWMIISAHNNTSIIYTLILYSHCSDNYKLKSNFQFLNFIVYEYLLFKVYNNVFFIIISA